MTKFITAWTQYETMLSSQLDYTRKITKMKEVLHNDEVDAVLKDKLTGEQQASLKELKDAIFETERKKAEREKKWR